MIPTKRNDAAPGKGGEKGEQGGQGGGYGGEVRPEREGGGLDQPDVEKGDDDDMKKEEKEQGEERI